MREMAPNTPSIKSPRKLIEVALPLDKINVAAAREKSIRHGHPSTLHLWWARRPLAAARAVLFAQLVNDPGYERHLNRGINKVEAVKERERLFRIIEKLVLWENTNNQEVLDEARVEIWKSWRETCELNRKHPDAATLFDPEKLPSFHDPFAGGGAIPLEAQRLGLESYASDLNPVAVTINKAMIEIPTRFAGLQPVGPVPTGERDPGLSRTDWPGTGGLAEDVRRYGAWMRTEAKKRIGHLYPTVEVTEEMAANRPDLQHLVGQSLTVIAWLWSHTVKSPNPAYSHVDVPLVSTFVLSSKVGGEAYVQPVIEGDQYRFTVKLGKAPDVLEKGTKISRGAFKCILSDSPMRYEYIDAEANAGRMGSRLLAIVADGLGSRVYLPPAAEHEIVAESAAPDWRPETPCRGTFASNAQGRIYGFKTFGDYFTKRQLVALNTFSLLLGEAMEKCQNEALAAGISSDPTSLDRGGSGALAYAQTIGMYLAFCVDKMIDTNTSLCSWQVNPPRLRATFGRQGIAMVWDFAEANIFGDAAGDFHRCVGSLAEVLDGQIFDGVGHAFQCNAATVYFPEPRVVSTDPPYYDNIGYADLSDFFYVWLRRLLRGTFPEMFATLAVPKVDELVADSYRHGSKAAAEAFFLSGMTMAMSKLADQSHPGFPVTIYYAFKQSDTSSVDGTASSGWETFLTAVMRSGFSIDGTWPLRSELASRNVGRDSNALASSIILVCRKRDPDASTISRRDFLRELNATLPDALIDMTRGGVNSPVAPVDLSQAIIGPGMGIFSKYKSVLEADGKPMNVRTALQLINRFLADDDFDPETRFCLQWFESNGWKPGVYGSADVAARAKGTSIDAIHRAGVLLSGGGEVALLRWTDLPPNWAPERSNQTPVWEALHYLIRALNTDGERAVGTLLARMPAVSGPVRTLAYRLYTLSERKGWAEDARPYNELIAAWAAIEIAANEIGQIETQTELF